MGPDSRRVGDVMQIASPSTMSRPLQAPEPQRSRDPRSLRAGGRLLRLPQVQVPRGIDRIRIRRFAFPTRTAPWRFDTSASAARMRNLSRGRRSQSANDCFARIEDVGTHGGETSATYFDLRHVQDYHMARACPRADASGCAAAWETSVIPVEPRRREGAMPDGSLLIAQIQSPSGSIGRYRRAHRRRWTDPRASSRRARPDLLSSPATLPTKATISSSLASRRFTVCRPCFMAMGNHDSREPFRASFDAPVPRTVSSICIEERR